MAIRKKNVKVIKASKTHPAGKIRIGHGASVFAEGEQPQVKIIERTNDYVIIEVACSCRRKFHIQCNFGG